MELTEKAKELFDLLFTKDFDETKLISRLSAGDLSPEDVNTSALEYVDQCAQIHNDDPRIDSLRYGERIPGMESSHLLEAVEILLEHGLDPNFSSNDDITGNIMWRMYFVHNGYQAADAAELMFEHGGDPNISFDGWSLIGELCADISWFLGGDVESRYIADTFAHYLMVVIGFGAKWEKQSKEDSDEDREIVRTYDDFKVSDFRDHRNYYCGFIHVEYDDDPINTSALSFFDKRTNREVARCE